MDLIKIALVDDHPMICKGVKSILKNKKNSQVIMSAYSGKELFSKLESLDVLPDIILLDIEMPDIGGREILAHINKNYPKIKVIIFSLHNYIEIVNEMIEHGAAGYLCKGAGVKEIYETIDNVLELGYYLDAKVKKKLIDYRSNNNVKSLTSIHQLNDNERTVLKHICHEKRNKQIAELMKLSEKSIEKYKAKLFKKTNTSSTVGLAFYGFKNLLDL